MAVPLLIDLIVRQTTVLIAQLSTAAGIRAPLADIADQVFVQLSSALEREGVPKKVIADMFGMALRSYQKKVQRLSESKTEHNQTLWQAVFDYVDREGPAMRDQIFRRFHNDDPTSIAAVLNDLVKSSFVNKTGSGEAVLYRTTPEQDRATIARALDLESIAALLWLTIYRSPSAVSVEQMQSALGVEPDVIAQALRVLTQQGRVQRDGELYRAATLLIPLGSDQGWESAVFDHFQAMAVAIGLKLSKNKTRADHADVIGGATLSFDIYDDHPHRERVLGLLKQVRGQVNELFAEFVAYDGEHPAPDANKTRVTFYFGQSVQENEEP